MSDSTLRDKNYVFCLQIHMKYQHVLKYFVQELEDDGRVK